MKYFFDTEFIEEPGRIDLISIGIVSEEGDALYLESSEVDWDRSSDWIEENVRPHLLGGEHLVTRAEIAERILRFVGDDPRPELWGYYPAYDWVVLCWLWGRMIDLPSHFPMRPRDLKQLAEELGCEKLPEQTSTEHHALADAEWNLQAWKYLRDTQKIIGPRKPFEYLD